MSQRHEADGWGHDAPKITAPENLESIRVALEESDILLEHRFYRGSRAPHRLLFEEFEDLEEYLRAKVWPGDSIWVWKLAECCSDMNWLTHGKFPDSDGTVPAGGAY